MKSPQLANPGVACQPSGLFLFFKILGTTMRFLVAANERLNSRYLCIGYRPRDRLLARSEPLRRDVQPLTGLDCNGARPGGHHICRNTTTTIHVSVRL
jgi:hypothetical protein